MVRTITKAKQAITGAAQRGAKTVKVVAGEVLSEAAKAAADVVLVKTADALATGRAKVTRSAPAMKRAVGNGVKKIVTQPGRRMRVAKRKPAAAKRKTKRRSR
jgi:predicted RNA-binding protein with EMAP domain